MVEIYTYMYTIIQPNYAALIYVHQNSSKWCFVPVKAKTAEDASC